MGIIQFKEANCKNCYKCIRNCDLKAIHFSGEQARILEDDCVLCGRCTIVCPQNAKQVASDLPLVKKYLREGAKVLVSLAPSYVSAFPDASFAAVSAALKKLGFTRVEETAIGATQVSAKYAGLMQEKKMKNIITTCCPTTVMLIEKYYPELLGCLAPVISPAMAHARILKEIFGNRSKVVFIGPCISKKQEAQSGTDINAVLLFDELIAWLNEEGIEAGQPDAQPAEMSKTVSRLYPSPGGIIQTIPAEQRKNYKSIAVDGLDRCMETLDSIRDRGIEGYFIEMSACAGSCIMGPGLHTSKTPLLISRDRLLSNARKRTAAAPLLTEDVQPVLSAHYTGARVRDKLPDEQTIQSILAQTGKYTQADMLNCGTCGYQTCRDKAIAVYQGKADIRMCLPYMREKAESLSGLVWENTPNAILLLDKEDAILELNKAAQSLFDLRGDTAAGMYIGALLESGDFEQLRKTGQPVYDVRRQTCDGQHVVKLTVVPVPNGDRLVIIRDVTGEEAEHRENEHLRRETIETAQRVIDKQMRVAQEIASLLGETTGETKAALTNLKRSMMQGEQT